MMLVACNPRALGVAVEPGLQALERLRLRLPDSVSVVPAAAGASNGTIKFYEQPDAGDHSSAFAAWAEDAHPRDVEVVTVDGLLDRFCWERIGLLKVDTEGYDGRVLEGAARALRGHRIDLVQFEYNRPWRCAGNTLEATVQSLTEVGYEVYVLRHGVLQAYDYDVFGDFFSYANFVAVSTSSALRSYVGLR